MVSPCGSPPPIWSTIWSTIFTRSYEKTRYDIERYSKQTLTLQCFAEQCKKLQNELIETPTLKVVRSNRIGRTKLKALNHNGFKAFLFFNFLRSKGVWSTVWSTIAIKPLHFRTESC